MTKTEAKQIVSQAFAALTARQRGNLRWHAENGTRVACGEHAEDFVTPSGHG